MKLNFNSISLKLVLLQSILVAVAFWGIVEIYEKAVRIEFTDFQSPPLLPDETLDTSDRQSQFQTIFKEGGVNAIKKEVESATNKLIFIDTNLKPISHNLGIDLDIAIEPTSDGLLKVTVIERGHEGQILSNLLFMAPPISLTQDGAKFGSLIVLPPADFTSIELDQEFASSVTTQATGLIIVILCLTILGGFIFIKLLFKPIDNLTKIALAIKEGRSINNPSHKMPNELKELAIVLDTASTEIHSRESLRKRFVADVAHEFRTPLTNLKGKMSALRDNLTEPDQAFQRIMNFEIATMERLIDDLQQLAKLDSGIVAVKKEELELKAELEETFNLMPWHDEAELDFQFNPQLTINVDKFKFRQIVRNLFENAWQHQKQRLLLTIAVNENVKDIELILIDNGLGIPDDKLNRIFERFYRIDTSRTRTTGGSGLGLSIVKSLVEAHGGSISAQSNDEGAEFHLLFPK